MARNIVPSVPWDGFLSSRSASSKNLAFTCFGVVPSAYSGCAAANFAKSGNRSSSPRPNSRMAVTS